jgi:TRAP-type C4-dicarboxylate transport system substrate-binding protein
MTKSILMAASIAALAALPGARPRAAETILIFDVIGTPGAATTVEALRPWITQVNQQAAGMIHIDLREGMGLATFENVYERVLDDVIQIGWGLPNAVAGKFPLSEVPAMPFLVKSSEVGSIAFWRLYKSGDLDSEYNEIVPLLLGMMGPGNLHLSANRSLDDLNGLKLLVAGRMQSATVTALGGTPISIPLTDMYPAIQRRTVDGVVTGWSSVRSFKLDEVAPDHVDVSIGDSVSFAFMSKAKLHSLPPAAQKILLETSGEALSRKFGAVMDADVDRIRDQITAQKGQEVVTLSPAQIALWRQKTASVVADWPKNKPGGDKVMQDFQTFYAAAEASGKPSSP